MLPTNNIKKAGTSIRKRFMCKSGVVYENEKMVATKIMEAGKDDIQHVAFWERVASEHEKSRNRTGRRAANCFAFAQRCKTILPYRKKPCLKNVVFSPNFRHEKFGYEKN